MHSKNPPGLIVAVCHHRVQLVSQAQELGTLAKSKKLVLYPFQNRRWDSDFLSLKKLLDLPADHPQSLGTLYEFESRYVHTVSKSASFLRADGL